MGLLKNRGGGWVLLIFLSMLSACAGENGTNGTNGVDGANGVNGTNASIQTTALDVGDENCPSGGVRIDVLSNGIVQTDQTQYICNGSKGDSGEAGAQGDASETGGNVSGSRLKARYASTPDGAKVFMGWYDSQLNEKCTFMLAEDGNMRCLPSASNASGEGFLDSQCLGQSFLAVSEYNCDKGTSRYAFFNNSNRSLCEQGRPASVFELHSHEECDETGYFYGLSESGECVKYYSCAIHTPYTYTKLDPETFVSVSTDETYE